jgi:hypothetical protein
VASITPELNWSGTYTYRTRQVHTPRTLDELRRLIDTASGSLHGLGTRHSFNDIADVDGLISAARRARSVVRPLPHFLIEFTPSSGAEIQSEYLMDRRYAGSAHRLVARARARHRTRRQECGDPYCRRDELWLSPASQQNVVGVHFTWQPDTAAVTALVESIEAVLQPFRPRPHLG